MVNNIILSSMIRVQNFIAAMKEERGQDLMEYAVLAGAIAILAFAAFFAFPMEDVINGFATEVCEAIDIGEVGC